MNLGRNKALKFIFIFFIILFFGLWIIRVILPSQLDDVNPLMNCSEGILDLADIYYVVPAFGGIAIDKEWCDYILSKDKEIAMHGVYHTFEEFDEVRDEDYFGEGVKIFRDCFGFAPDRFKPGHLQFSDENDWIRDEVEVDLFWNQVFHKVYHCGDSGRFPNWLMRIY